MATGGTPVAALQAVDDSARSLYRRARAGGPEFADVAVVVRSLHTVLKHLRVEAEDHDSLLNAQQQHASVYARQLTPLVEDCDFTLKQLETIFEKYGPRDGHGDRGLDEREKNMVAMIRTKLANQKTNIDMFLDTIQLHNPAKAHRPWPLESDSPQLEDIKDKVDKVARRLFQRRIPLSAAGDTTDDLWQQFSTELINEGFSRDVLHRNKEVLRAYIRELESKGFLDDGSVPSVRGLLPSAGAGHVTAADAPRAGHGVSLAPADDGATSPKEIYHPNLENEKFSLDVKDARIMPGRASPQYHPAHVSHPPPQPQQAGPGILPPVLYHDHTNVSYDPYTSDESDTDDHGGVSSQSALVPRRLELISTRDLMDLDRQEHEYMAGRMDDLRLSPGLPPPSIYSVSPGTSPNSGLLGPPEAPVDSQALSISPTSQLLSSSPRYVPSLPSYSALSPPPSYGSSPVADNQMVSYPPFPANPNMRTRYQQVAYKLAPDPYGREIPMDAKWTKIRRSLVSPAVLEQAKLRYEARPTFVAVLGMLSRAEIEDFARRSAELRSARGQAYPRKPSRHRPTYQAYGGKHSHRSGSTSESDSDTLWDESDTTEDEKHSSRKTYNRGRYVPKSEHGEKALDDDKGTKVYPFIVSPPTNEGSKTSPASTTQPKPILKNKNENHVRFEADGPVEISPAEAAKEKERAERRERRRERDRNRDHDRDHDRDRERRRRRDQDRDRERDRDGHRRRDRERDRDHDGSRRHPRDGNRDAARDRRDDRSRDGRQDDRAAKKASLRETFGAVGIGGAAATLLSVLTEAAVGI